MNISRFTDSFFSMERDLGLFKREAFGLQAWEPARHDAFYAIYHALIKLDRSQQRGQSLWQKMKGAISYGKCVAQLETQIALRRADVIAFRAPRHLSDGRLSDIILDDVLGHVRAQILPIDTSPFRYHVRPAFRIYEGTDPPLFSDINLEVKRRFGLSVDIASLIDVRFRRFRSELEQYRRLFDRTSPKVVLMVQNGIEKALFLAARERGITVVEAQHGLIDYVHPQYSYPEEVSAGSLSTLPDIFLAMSDYWIERCHYPVARKEVIGNRHYSAHGVTARTNEILVISGDIYEKNLEEVMRLSASERPKRIFNYKLHPSQYFRATTIKARLKDLHNVNVIAGETSLADLIRRCSDALCIQSTGVYEALQCGTRVCLLTRQDYETHADVFEHPGVALVADHRDLLSVLDRPRTRPDWATEPTYFDALRVVTIKKVLSELGI